MGQWLVYLANFMSQRGKDNVKTHKNVQERGEGNSFSGEYQSHESQ